MGLEIGNKIAVLDDILKGVIVDIIGDDILVKTTDGMVFTFKTSEIVKIETEQHELSKFTDINNSLLKEKISERFQKKTAFKKHKNEVVFEVDLHIDKLTNSTKNMDNYDMLNLQLDTAKNKIEYAISKKISKVIFIHGVGEGVLKSELQRLLKKYPVKFYDASYKKYGLGATEVYVFQNSN